jgi:hypothetical protein
MQVNYQNLVIIKMNSKIQDYPLMIFTITKLIEKYKETVEVDESDVTTSNHTYHMKRFLILPLCLESNHLTHFER